MKALLLLALVGFASAHHESISSMYQDRVKELLDVIQGPDYVPSLRPQGVDGKDATVVTIQLAEVKVIDVDETNGQFTFQTYARKEWVDPRLAYNDTKISYIPITDCKTMWKPDFFMTNEVNSEMSHMHKYKRVIKIYPNGKVFYSGYLTKTLTCANIIKTDKEFTCTATISSYGYFDDEIVVKFKETDGVTMQTPVEDYMPKFNFVGVKSVDCDPATLRLVDEDGHKHSCVKLEFKFTRE